MKFGEFSPDCLVFDVDGVLIESHASYQETIRILVEREWKNAGLETDRPGYSKEMNEVLKNNGSFNDDYEIIWTLLNIAASGGEKKLSKALPSPEELEKLISGCPGDCVKWLPQHYGVKYALPVIRKLGQSIYTGSGGEPGAWKLDEPMLKTHWRHLPYPVYIYTGRDMTEWRLAQQVLSWEDFPDERVVQVDMGIKKPSPRGLEYICEKFSHERPAFFGDTMSDKMSADAFGRGYFIAIGDMIPEAQTRFPNIQNALSELIGWNP